LNRQTRAGRLGGGEIVEEWLSRLGNGTAGGSTSIPEIILAGAAQQWNDHVVRCGDSTATKHLLLPP